MTPVTGRRCRRSPRPGPGPRRSEPVTEGGEDGPDGDPTRERHATTAMAVTSARRPTRPAVAGWGLWGLGALAFLIGSSLLLTLDASRAIQPYLPTRYWLSWIDFFRDPVLWRDIERGAGLQLVFLVVLLGAAWANFMTRDVSH